VCSEEHWWRGSEVCHSQNCNKKRFPGLVGMYHHRHTYKSVFPVHNFENRSSEHYSYSATHSASTPPLGTRYLGVLHLSCLDNDLACEHEMLTLCPLYKVQMSSRLPGQPIRASMTLKFACRTRLQHHAPSSRYKNDSFVAVL
jgi:hypothetical protein